MASLLSSEKNNTDKISFYIEECRAMGIEVKPPSIQYSYDDFNVCSAKNDDEKHECYGPKSAGTAKNDGNVFSIDFRLCFL